jgi:hypothetical protein
MKRRLVTIGLVLAFCLGVVVTRAVWEGRSALFEGDVAAQSRGDQEDAIRWWRRAARWYVPLAPHVGRAYDRLEELGARAEKEGDLATALAAWQGVRGSILATRSFFTPHQERLEPANRRIAALLAAMEQSPPEGSRAAGLEAWHHELLARDEAPALGWTILALLGFLVWLGGGVLFALRGVSAEDRLVARPAITAGVLVVAGLLVWVLGLHNA